MTEVRELMSSARSYLTEGNLPLAYDLAQEASQMLQQVINIQFTRLILFKIVFSSFKIFLFTTGILIVFLFSFLFYFYSCSYLYSYSYSYPYYDSLHYIYCYFYSVSICAAVIASNYSFSN